jgi:hypothetical protein
MYDNKIRLSSDVLEKAERIAAEWGLKNARAAIEAVFRCYSDDYLYGRHRSAAGTSIAASAPAAVNQSQTRVLLHPPIECEALSELDDLLNM